MATLITVKQINYLLTRDLGFKKDAIINVNTPIFPDEIKITGVSYYLMKSNSCPAYR